MEKIMFYDVETSGLYYFKNAILTIAGIIEIGGEVVEEFSFKVQPHPKAIIDDKALEINRITREDIEDFAEQKDVHNELKNIFGRYVDKFNKKDKFFLAGYNNASFDDNFLSAFFKQSGDDYLRSWFHSGSLDVMILASQYLKAERVNMVDFKLKTVAAKLGIAVDESKLHDAAYDIELTRLIYNKVTARNTF